MINPTTISEELLYSTLRLVNDDGSSGTGFIFYFKFEDRYVNVIITNKHVVQNKENTTMSFYLHTFENNVPSKESHLIIANSNWIFHPDKDVDLCFCFLQPIINQFEQLSGKRVYFKAIQEDLIYSDIQLESLTSLEQVIMVGYPNGLWDEFNNFPIFRSGYTASHPALDFNSKDVGMIDMACFPGSSGSPIFILNEIGYTDKQNNTIHMGQRFIFLGILYAGPVLNIRGEIVVEDIPTSAHYYTQIGSMINLGYYLKAKKVLDFRKIIENYI